MSKKRLFIAINLPDEVKRKLVEWRGKWDFDKRYINWVIKKNIHITLIFIGYVDNDETYRIAKIIGEVAKKHQPFYINLEKIIAGPPNATPRMFWVEGEKSQELANLQMDLENALSFGGNYKKEARAFRPHITLARFKYEVTKKIREMGSVEEKINYQIPVDSIELMQSDLRRTGPIYTNLESAELGEHEES